VAAESRPIVLTAPPITGPDGFTSDEAKLAFEEGAIAPVSGITPEVLKALGARDLSGHRGHSLRVLGVSRRTAPFRTDRGLRRLPAWEVSLRQTHGALTVLDPQVQATAWFPAAANLDLATGFGQWGRLEEDSRSPTFALWGRLEEDSRSLTFRFMGSNRKYTDYPPAEVLESDAAVVVCPVAVEKPGMAARRGPAQAREVSVTLHEPLGARVFVSLAGLPVMIEMSATD
jgi:hypothetical protein